jgi:hypothetical protein
VHAKQFLPDQVRLRSSAAGISLTKRSPISTAMVRLRGRAQTAALIAADAADVPVAAAGGPGVEVADAADALAAVVAAEVGRGAKLELPKGCDQGRSLLFSTHVFFTQQLFLCELATSSALQL